MTGSIPRNNAGPALLASVTSAEEALVALRCGAGIIDLKNPEQGALGALPLPVVREVAAAVGGRRAVSATVGDLPMQPALLCRSAADIAATGVDIVKIGFFGESGHAACLDALRPLAASGVKIVAVLFADGRPDFGLVPLMAEAGLHGVMLDTAAKNGRRLPDYLDRGRLRQFVDGAHACGMLTGLAGSLSMEDIPVLADIGPDYLGFRGALCRASDRKAALDPERMAEIAHVLCECNRCPLEPA